MANRGTDSSLSAERRRVTVTEALTCLPGATGASFAPVFEHGTLLVEILAPPSLLPLPPHTRDELYVVVQGSGDLFNDGGYVHFTPGDVLFVPAGAEHHFENFSDDLVIWAVFYGPEGGEGGEERVHTRNQSTRDEDSKMI